MTTSVSGSVVVDAPPQAVFDLLADPRKHPLIDGSGMLREGLSGPARLSLGAKFGMSMRYTPPLRVPYRITNTVVEFEEGRRIAWRHVARHVWRYELAPAEGGGTTVTETFDWGPAPAGAIYPRVKLPAKNTKAIKETLVRLQQHFAGSTAAG